MRRSFKMAQNKKLDQFKGRVLEDKGYNVNKTHPDAVKYEVAQEQEVPLKKGYNGGLTSEQAGKVGGPIGGNMVKAMVKMAQERSEEHTSELQSRFDL